MAGVDWTHPSVLKLADDAAAGFDPVEVIEERARIVTLTAIEKGWVRPAVRSVRAG